MRQGIDPEEEANETLIKAKNSFSTHGILEELIDTKIRIGVPTDEIIKDIEENKYNLIIMGRRGRSVLKDLVLGGVSSAVINKCFETTVAIMNIF